jgi:hypothetical protein
MGLFSKKKKQEEFISQTQVTQMKELVKPKLTARIVGCTLRDDGLKEYLVLTNSELGELGEEFEL